MRWASPRQHSGLPRDLAIAVVGIVVFGSVLAVPMTWVADRVLGPALPWADRLASGSTVAVPPLPERSTIHAADGSILATLFEENREVVPLDRVRPVTRRAVLAIEDAGFFKHYGIDPAAVARATFTNLASGEITEGASTITQQLARNTIPGVGTEETLGRKVVEAVTAMGLERRYSKTRILELYLNEAYFGSGAHGIAAASERYFAKAPEQLNLPESAFLAGLIAAPEGLSPFQRPRGALSRRNTVLDRMVEEGWIGPERASRAKGRPLELSPREPPHDGGGIAPYLVEFVRRQFLTDPRFGPTPEAREQLLYRGGLRIHTTLDPGLARAGQEAVRRHLPLPEDPEAAIAAVDPRTGAIRALVGGSDFGERQFDLATQGHRQSGSAFKPFTLAAALERGFSTARVYDSSSPKRLSVPHSKPWTVANAEGGGLGPIDLVEATVQSVNVVYAQLILDVGPERVVDVARRMGIVSELPPVPSLTLGTASVSPLEMASAFGTLAHEGVHCQPFVIEKVVDGAGSTIMEQDAGPCRRALRGGIASRAVWMLEQVIQRGTGTAASLGSRPAFGKTGTTDDYSDAWFVGCTVQLCAATWVGHQRAPIPMPDVHGTAVFGGTFPAEIWRDFMLVAMRSRPRIVFPEPPPIPRAVLAPPEPAPVELDGGESESDGEGTGEEGQGEGHGEEGNGKGNGNEGNQGRGQGDGG